MTRVPARLLQPGMSTRGLGGGQVTRVERKRRYVHVYLGATQAILLEPEQLVQVA